MIRLDVTRQSVAVADGALIYVQSVYPCWVGHKHDVSPEMID